VYVTSYVGFITCAQTNGLLHSYLCRSTAMYGQYATIGTKKLFHVIIALTVH